MPLATLPWSGDTMNQQGRCLLHFHFAETAAGFSISKSSSVEDCFSRLLFIFSRVFLHHRYPPEALIPNKTFVWVKRRPTLKTRIQIIESEAASRDYRPTPASPGSDEDGNNVLSRLTRKEIIPEEWPPEFLCPVCAEPLESATFVKCCRATVCEKCVQEDDEGNCSLCHEIWEGTVRDVLMRGVVPTTIPGRQFLALEHYVCFFVDIWAPFSSNYHKVAWLSLLIVTTYYRTDERHSAGMVLHGEGGATARRDCHEPD